MLSSKNVNPRARSLTSRVRGSEVEFENRGKHARMNCSKVSSFISTYDSFLIYSSGSLIGNTKVRVLVTRGYPDPAERPCGSLGK